MKTWYRSDSPQNQNVVLQIFFENDLSNSYCHCFEPVNWANQTELPTGISETQFESPSFTTTQFTVLLNSLFKATLPSKHLNSSKELNSRGKMAQCIGHQSPSVGCGLCQRWTCTSQVVFCKEASQTQSSPQRECWCWFNCHYQELHIVVFFSSSFLYA